MLERSRNRKIQRYLLAALVLLLPYHTMASYIIGKYVPIMKFWKELVIIIIFGLFLYDVIIDYIKNKVVYKLSCIEVFLILFIIVEMIYIVFSDSKYRAIYIGRIYIMPLLLVSPVKHMDIHTGYAKKLIMAVMGNTIILCLWGSFQALVLKDTFLINIGYEASRRWGPLMLNDEFYINSMGNFQRMTSTFAAPNTCGIYLDIVLLLVLFTSEKLNINKVFKYITIGIALAGLAFTFSRTAWISMAAGLILYGVTMVKWTKKRALLLLEIIFAAAFVIVVLDGIFMTFNISAALFHLVVSTINGSDSSVNGHLTSIVESIENIARNPMGLGMGNNGPRVKIFMDKPNLTESSYFLMAYEIGIFGAIIYFASYYNTFIVSLKNYKRKHIKSELLVVAIMLVMILAFLSLPYIQDFDLLVFVYIIMALQGVDIRCRQSS